VAQKKAAHRVLAAAAMLLGIPRERGTYALIYRCEETFRAVAGKLGPVCLSPGYWIYIGSAFGPGGLRSRLIHHLKPSPRPHWHLDYVKHGLTPIEIWLTTDAVRREHAWAGDLARLKGAACPISGFGASDCTCRSHMIHLRRRPGFRGFKTRVPGRIMRISVPLRAHN
jgi:Uri superfamily endonuclease